VAAIPYGRTLMADSDNWAVEWLKRRRGALSTEESATMVMMLGETQSLADGIVKRRNDLNERWQQKQDEMYVGGISDKSQRWLDERDAYIASMTDLDVRQKAVTVFTNRLSQ
jgi:Mg2+ and Co2+ transporter CorA